MSFFQNFLLFFVLSTVASQTFLKVVWNMPSRPCVRKGIDIPLDKYKISYNEGHHFAGGNITIFYERKFGLCPYYDNNSPDAPINGALPQNVSLTEHLKRIEQQIQEQIPDPNYSGLAVIDLEEWRPLWVMNFGAKRVYQNMSIKLVQEKRPKLPLKEARIQAEKEFNEAARKFFVQTLKKAKKLRPKALWGYYIYPFCDAKAGDDEHSYSCSAEAQKFNDDLDFLYKESTALFPSIYLNGTTDIMRNLRHTQAVLNETRRIANKQTPSTRFFVYTKIEYDPVEKPHAYYNEVSLQIISAKPVTLSVTVPFIQPGSHLPYPYSVIQATSILLINKRSRYVCLSTLGSRRDRPLPNSQ